MQFQPEQILFWKTALGCWKHTAQIRIDEVHTVAYSNAVLPFAWSRYIQIREEAVLVSLGQQCGAMRWLGAVEARLSKQQGCIAIYYLAPSEVATLQHHHLL
jgi:hypothetical protein